MLPRELHSQAELQCQLGLPRRAAARQLGDAIQGQPAAQEPIQHRAAQAQALVLLWEVVLLQVQVKCWGGCSVRPSIRPPHWTRTWAGSQGTTRWQLPGPWQVPLARRPLPTAGLCPMARSLLLPVCLGSAPLAQKLTPGGRAPSTVPRGHSSAEAVPMVLAWSRAVVTGRRTHEASGPRAQHSRLAHL